MATWGAKFNQRGSLLAVWTGDGFQVHRPADALSLPSDAPKRRPASSSAASSSATGADHGHGDDAAGELPASVLHDSRIGGCALVELLHHSSLVAVVGGGLQPAFSRRSVRLWNVKTETTVCEFPQDEAVLGVHMSDSRLAIVQRRYVAVFDLATAKFLQTVATTPNELGLCALAEHDGRGHLVVPRSVEEGVVAVYDLLTLEAGAIVDAHKSPLAAVALSVNGQLLATASRTGTIVRVFDASSGDKLFAFRRGSTSSTLHSLVFSPDNRMLAVCGETKTVHIYRLEAEARPDSGELASTTKERSRAGSAESAASAATGAGTGGEDAAAEGGKAGIGSAGAGLVAAALNMTGLAEATRDSVRVKLLDGSPAACALGSLDAKGEHASLSVVSTAGVLHTFLLTPPAMAGSLVSSTTLVPDAL